MYCNIQSFLLRVPLSYGRHSLLDGLQHRRQMKPIYVDGVGSATVICCAPTDTR